MSAFLPAAGRQRASWLPFRLAARELRGGLRGFVVFIACIALGVMAITAVGSFARSLTEGLSREGRTILGGDLAFSLIHREATPQERDFLASQGALSVAATMRAMARTADGRTALVEIKAVDGRYPLTGSVALEPVMPLADALARRGDVFGAAADPALLVRLDLKAGDRISVGDAQIEIRSVLRNEPDKLAGGIHDLGSGAEVFTQRGDAPAGDADIALEGVGSGGDGTAADNGVEGHADTPGARSAEMRAPT